MRLLTILARAGTEHYAGADQRIKSLLAESCPRTHRRMLIVDNALETDFEAELDPTTRLIGGDTRAREFSGWDRAIRYLGKEIDRYDVIHLATSAFDQLYSRYINRFDDGIVRLVANRPIAVGHVDYYPYPIAAFGGVSQHWLRSSYFFLAPRELRALGPLANVDRSSLFTGMPEAPFHPDAPISDSYRKLISDWLTSEMGTGQGTAWHSHFHLTSETLQLFEDKTVSILHEHGLSIRLRAQGCRTVDVTWLSTVMKGTDIFFAAIPGWRRQLSARDNDSCQPPIADKRFEFKVSFDER